MDEILLNIESREIRYAHLKNGQLHNLIIERKKERRITGNIYRGRVKNVLHNIQSAFIDIGEGDNGFIHISDIVENSKKLEQQFDMDFDFDKDEKNEEESSDDLDINQLLKSDQPVLVQVVKEPIGTKGARLTSNISIAGRYLVLLPNSSHRGVSRKIEDRFAREKLKRLIRSFEMPHDMGLICRTASCFASEQMLIDEAHDLFSSWKNIRDQYEKGTNPKLLFEESDIIKRALMTAIDHRYSRILVDDYTTYQILKRLYSRYSNEHPLRIELYRDKVPMFERFNIEKEIEKSLRRKIWLPSGGYLFFDKTEAMTTIDVNSGRSTSEKGDVEESLVRINIEAAEEIARQLRLRNIGGLIVCDFIDMRFRKNQRRVLDRLKDCMKEDSAKCTILAMSEFGLVEMTRQRSREALSQTIYTHCPYCQGSGLVKTFESMTIEIERALKKVVGCYDQFGLKLMIHPQLETFLEQTEKEYLQKVAEKMNASLTVETNENIHLNDFFFYSTLNQQKIEV